MAATPVAAVNLLVHRLSSPVISTMRLCIAILALLISAGAGAHFQLNVNIRVAHVEHVQNGLNGYLRLPAPYVLAPELGPIQSDGSRAAAPYTINRMEGEQLMHIMDWPAVALDPIGLGQLVEKGHTVAADGARVVGQVESVRVHTANSQPPFSNLAEAKAAFTADWSTEGLPETYAGDAVIDVKLHYRTGGAVYEYAFSSNLDPGLENQDDTANLVLDHFPGGSSVFRATGLLADPIVVSRSALSAAWTFVIEGAKHILEGADHVLFVICLIIGASTLTSLLWRITGFTIGHSVTLATGFFGWVPTTAWFVPAVETGIALSIIYAAVIALMRYEEKSSFLVTALIGLLHGLGFSFVLQEILQVDSPNLWQSLLAFNVGIEIGQLGIALFMWPGLYWLYRIQPSVANVLRWSIAIPCIAIAAWWTGQRGMMALGFG